MKKVLLVDGNNILHRAYHGLPLLKTSDGRYTNAVFGFLKMLKKVLDSEQPTHVAICFDKGKNTFRHRMFPEYKGQRKPTDPELAEQFPLIREVMALNGYICLESDEYEADDLMGTLAKKAVADGGEAIIFSGDKDLLQVLGDGITVISGKKQLTDLVKTDAVAFHEKYGLEPIRLIDLKGLMGDSSDNIPGVKGVGEKTALKFLTEYETLENLYDHIEDLPKNKMREKLVNDRGSAFLSKELATIITDVPLDLTWDDLVPKTKDYDRLMPLYRDLEFKGYLKELEDERPHDLFSENLFDIAMQERPFDFEIIRDHRSFLKENTLALFNENDTLYLASKNRSVMALSWETDRDAICEILENANIDKICAELKSLYHHCFDFDIHPVSIVDAIEIAAYLDDANLTSYRLSELSRLYLKTDTYLFDEDRFYAETCLIFDLRDVLKKCLEEKNSLALYNNVELPLTAVLADMEHCGIRVDKNTLLQMSEELGEQIDAITEDIYRLAGEEFNINSSKQLSVILFEKLGLPKGKKTKTKTGYSTNSEVLEKLHGAHPVIEKILEYRMLSKLKSTYTDGVGKFISPGENRIHTKFLQTVTTTGRLSSADPNLQNIPVRVEEGRKIRKAFIASDEDHILLAADYSQIELRLLAHFSEDPILISSFLSGEDIHARTAGEIFGVPQGEVTSEMRRAAKAVNFGIIYGISSYGLGNDLGISRKQAQEYIDGYFARYENIKEYLEGTVVKAKACGYAETLMGRRRYLPDLMSKNFNSRSFAERTAMNTPLQGSAADIIKLVMVKLHAALAEQGFESKVILQVHDELILDCPRSEMERVIPFVKEVMEQTVSLRVPLTVDMKAGDNWYHMEKL